MNEPDFEEYANRYYAICDRLEDIGFCLCEDHFPHQLVDALLDGKMLWVKHGKKRTKWAIVEPNE